MGSRILSRTDNTDPHWVRAIWWEPDHWRCQYSMFNRRECDLPAEPIVAKEHGIRWRAHGLQRCSWVPTYDGMTTGGGWSAPPWFCRVEFTVPERRRVRDQLNQARAEYRATGEVDIEIQNYQHRHRANWDWW
jgi:hypothetical protein